MKKKILMALCGVMVASCNVAELRLASLFSDGMVLHREQPVPKPPLQLFKSAGLPLGPFVTELDNPLRMD